MEKTTEFLPFSGDIETQTTLKVNTKGGSTTATLRKPLVQKLGKIEDHLEGVTLQFEDGPAIVLMRTDVGEGTVRINRVGDNKFEVELADDGGEFRADPIAAAFLLAKEDLFLRGELELLPPVNADQWREEMTRKLATGDKG